MDIRLEIRSIIRELLNEAVPSVHFKERVFDRLVSSRFTNPPFNYDEISKELDLVKKIDFPGGYAFAIMLKRTPTKYISKDPLTNNYSKGNEVWVVVRDNEITTAFFRDTSQKATPVSNVDYTLDINKLLDVYKSSNKDENGHVYLSINDLTSTGKNKPGKGSRKKVGLDLPTVNIANKDWYIDEKNEELIYAKNIKKKLSFDDLKEEILEKVIEAVA